MLSSTRKRPNPLISQKKSLKSSTLITQTTFAHPRSNSKKSQAKVLTSLKKIIRSLFKIGQQGKTQAHEHRT